MGLLITLASRPISFMLSGHPRYKVTSSYPSRSSQEHSFYTRYLTFTEHHSSKKGKISLKKLLLYS
jgi:hypothetical protein